MYGGKTRKHWPWLIGPSAESCSPSNGKYFWYCSGCAVLTVANGGWIVQSTIAGLTTKSYYTPPLRQWDTIYNCNRCLWSVLFRIPELSKHGSETSIDSLLEGQWRALHGVLYRRRRGILFPVSHYPSIVSSGGGVVLSGSSCRRGLNCHRRQFRICLSFGTLYISVGKQAFQPDRESLIFDNALFLFETGETISGIFSLIPCMKRISNTDLSSK